MLTPLAIVLASRVGLILFAYLGLALVPARDTSLRLPGNLFINGWLNWDANWYAMIAQHGYTNTPRPGSDERDTAFLPLYPLLIRGAGKVLGDLYIGGWLVANVSFVLAALLLFRLVEARWSAEIAQRTLVLLCVYPYSYAFTAMYTESPFILCALGAFWFGERRKWLPAAICAGAAWSIRQTGAASAATLVFMYLQNAQWKARNIRWDACWLLLGFAGFGSYVVYLWLKFNEPLMFYKSLHAENWSNIHSWAAAKQVLSIWAHTTSNLIASGNVPLIHGMHMLMILMALILCAVGWRMLPAHYSVWAALAVFISLYHWAGFGRYFAPVFPAFIVLALLLHDRRLYHGVVYLWTLWLAILTFLFTHGMWVA
jgi:hypothetical protein